jgi:hypothetical protein
MTEGEDEESTTVSPLSSCYLLETSSSQLLLVHEKGRMRTEAPVEVYK